MALMTDLARMTDAEISNKFKGLVEGYAKDLAKSNKSKGDPGTASIASVRVGKIKRKKGQLVPSQILLAMRAAIWKMGWAQGVLRDEEGRLCLRGAMVWLYRKGYFHQEDGDIAAQWLHDEVRRKNGDAQKYNFIYWNNDPRRTLAEILKILEDAGNRAKLAGE
ncbi:hypothetical protein HWB80_gp068 [Streptomyces phage Karimac]|uniref:Uncharacterized protein n=1 Tax=Streptomyces phage Karimac TaxID=2283303 RepID=A0A345MHN6_9CAUD|nr:hypothetical protein HWB80_gp068 [Streptomyces phage Karimac]AXH70067.1 hypothetical protein SEA_KARIMAC_255 [Streptomyces phage Karimac]